MKKKGAFRYSGAMALFFIPYLLTAAVNGMETAILNRTPDLEEYIPVKIVALKDYDATVLSETGKTSIDNQGSRISLQYTAKEAGRYEFRFNVPVSDISIFTEQGARVSEYYIDERHIFLTKTNIKKGSIIKE